MTVHARAPLRINDIGGWTDTWFAKEGNVLNLAVNPGVEVQVRAFANERKRKKRVVVRAENYDQSFWMDPDFPSAANHPLLQFAIAALPIPADLELEIQLYSPVPASISTGTSASVCVGLIGALNRMTCRGLTTAEIASLAHRVETDKMGGESGVQDQICAAYGGVCFIRVHRYPDSSVERLELSEPIREELERRLCLIYLGKPHRSSLIHRRIVSRIRAGQVDFRQLRVMKNLAAKAKDALIGGDFDAYGSAMSLNNECQRLLCPGLVSPKADTVIRLARRFGAAGWKVNGAGGSGGSLTILAGADDGLRRRMLGAIDLLGEGIRALPVSLSREGLKAWSF